MKPEWLHGIDESGFALAQNILSEDTLGAFFDQLSNPALRRSRAGIRHALGVEGVADIARNKRLMEMVRSILGSGARPFRATVFDKSPISNWLVVWHQDTALPIRERRDKAGWGPWSVKDAINYAHAPARALEQILALRVHLDDSAMDNGPLRLLPGTHKLGVLTDDEIQAAAEKTAAVDCLVPKGGVLAMRPLIVHASSKSTSDHPRRVLHIEYAGSLFIEEGMELAIA